MNDTVRAAVSPLRKENSVLPRGGNGRLADLAFGSQSLRADEALTTEGLDRGRHLAFLPADALEIDLGDSAQRQFGDYELLEQIGEGGMGVVYRARQISLDREVAVKLLSAGPWASRDFVERFQREAQNAARMQHPNIVAIHEVGAVDEMHFFSMRLIRGSSLAQTIRDGPRLTPRRVAALMRTIAEAVDYAHRLGVLHLDLKPANVLLDEAGEPHVADFGLARRLESGSAADNTEVSGTPSYMAPEQATPGAQKITTATDIWGLGAILYELVTGKPPFAGATAQATLKLVTEGRLRNPQRYEPNLPRDLEAIILKCMARNVADRYVSARALADDLTRFIEGREVRARPLNGVQRGWRWARREPKLALTALLALVALLTGLAATTQQWQRANTNAASAEANARSAQANAALSRQRLWEGRRDEAVRLMRDGNGFEALTRLLANIDEQEQAGTGDPSGIERREIGMILQQGVTLIDRMVVPDAMPLAAGLSPDGSLLALGFADMTVRWYDTAGLTERGRVDVAGMPTSDDQQRAPRMLRFVDNHRLRVTLDWFDYLASPSNNDTYLVDLDRSQLIDFPPQFEDPTEAIFSADGRHAMLRNTHGDLQLWQADPWKPLGPLTPQPQTYQWPGLLGRGARYDTITEEGVTNFLSWQDPRNPSPRRQLPLHSPVTAWTENRAGTLIALGNSKGDIYLMDTTTRALRPLPAPPGQEVTWLAFSDDDAWIAAVRRDGAAFAFDVASGNPLVAGQMQNDFEAREVAISHKERLLIVAGFGETALWRMPEEGPNAREATRIIAATTRATSQGTNSLGISLQARLLVTTNMDGEVRLWRLPAPTVLPARAGNSDIAGNHDFDGHHVADIAYDHVRVFSTEDGKHSPWLALPQPVAYAQVLDGGDTLIATSGHSLYVVDVATMSPRFVPVDLPANPMRVAVCEGIAVLAFGTSLKTGFLERLIAYDIKSGEKLGQAAVDGPLRQFQLSPERSRLLTVGPGDGATEVFDARTLRRIGVYSHDSARPITSAAFMAESDSLWLLARDATPETARDADLLRWNARAGTIDERRHVAGSFPVGVTAVSERPFVATRDRDVLDPDTPNEQTSKHRSRDESTAVFALSHDGRLLAHAIGQDVQIYDTASLSDVGPPLHSYLHSAAYPLELAFSPDDKFLLARQKPWVLWPVGIDSRPVDQLRRQIELLNPAAAGPRVLSVPSADERAELRRADPGPPAPEGARPAPAAARLVNGAMIPARNPTTSPLLLDLTDVYGRSLDSVADVTSSVIGGQLDFASGVARMDGVDYDIRGAVELRQNGPITASTATGIRVPAIPIAAFHVLLYAPLPSPVADVRDYSSLRVHYRDGSSASLPIRTQREVPGGTGHDAPTPVGWVRGLNLILVGLSRQQLINNPRLLNPHPERLVATIDLGAATQGWANPMFFAVTAEPVIATADNGKDNVDNPNAATNPTVRTRP